MTLIDTLIDKQDTFEIVRDQIAAILVAEVANQMALAIAASEEPEDWNLRIFTERSNPWEEFQDDPVSNTTPLVNILFDNSTFEKSASTVVERQKSETIYNIDIYGYGVSADDGGSGQEVGDEKAAFEVQRAVRLVRNILMAATYTYLDLQGTVWGRWPQAITAFQPTQDENPVQHVQAVRIAFSVGFSEFSPQVTPETLDTLTACVKRAENGEIVLETQYDYPLP